MYLLEQQSNSSLVSNY